MSRLSRKKAQRRASGRQKQNPHDTIIGWFAQDGRRILCDGDSCIIAGTRQALEKMAKRVPHCSWQLRQTTFADIHAGIFRNAAYSFDEAAYERFYPLAQQIGLPVGPEDFSDPGPTGIHLVRIQWFSL